MIRILYIPMVISLALSWPAYVQADANILPSTLLEHARQIGCAQINDFYDRPGRIDPAYVYGYIDDSGDPHKEYSAAYWCKKEDSAEPYMLIVWIDKDHIPNGKLSCPTRVEWKNYPGGLSLSVGVKQSMDDFWYRNDPTRNGPAGEYTQGTIIVSEYDGVVESFYCFKGKWLVNQKQ